MRYILLLALAVIIGLGILTGCAAGPTEPPLSGAPPTEAPEPAWLPPLPQRKPAACYGLEPDANGFRPPCLEIGI